MDADRFDAAIRSLSAAPSRRALLGRAAGGLLVALGLAGSNADTTEGKRKKKRKKKCRGCAVCTSCVKGRCRAVPDHTACGGVCQECIGGQCVDKPDDTACNGDGACLDGLCNPRPQCQGPGVIGCVQLGSQICCSGECDQGENVCEPAVAGDPCEEDNDCVSNSCVGYRCQ